MAGAFVDGALKGFNMMERHQERLDNKARLADLDAFEKKKYNDQQGRLADIDKQKAMQREQDVAFRNKEFDSDQKYRADTLSNIDRNFEENQKNSLWKQNFVEREDQFKKDQQVIPIAWQSFRQTGQIPDDLSDVLARNKGMDPRTYLKQEYRESVKGLNQTLDEVVKTGDLKLANNPTTVKLFNDVFGDKIQSSVGQYDPELKATIDDVRFGGFVPTEMKDGSVALLLNVTYKNDKGETFTEQKPMTKGRTSEGDDPVMTYSPKELIGTIKTRAMMADMMERPEYWDKMGAQVGASFGQRSQAKEAPKEAEYRKAKVQLLEAKAKALSDIESGKGSTMPLTGEAKAQALAGVEAQFSNQLKQLESIYGSPESASGANKGKRTKYISKVEGVDAKGVIAKFMEANKNLSEQQATQIAIQKGYLSNDQ